MVIGIIKGRNAGLEVNKFLRILSKQEKDPKIVINLIEDVPLCMRHLKEIAQGKRKAEEDRLFCF